MTAWQALARYFYSLLPPDSKNILFLADQAVKAPAPDTRFFDPCQIRRGRELLRQMLDNPRVTRDW